jgi:dTDP-4-dehydrorhamnose 3,5-epimerase
MPLTTTATPIEGVVVIEPKVFGDARGFFYESFNAREFQDATQFNGAFVQDNHSRSAKGVLRGLHFQINKPQGKLVRVVSGEVFDVAVDIRTASPTFGQWFGIHLSEANQKQLWIAPGLAHGFLVVSETADFLYKTTDYWYPQFERSLAWNDPQLAIAWPLEGRTPQLAAKDEAAPFLATLREPS